MKKSKYYKFWICLSLYIFFMGFLGCKENSLTFNPFKTNNNEDIYAKNSETNKF